MARSAHAWLVFNLDEKKLYIAFWPDIGNKKKIGISKWRTSFKISDEKQSTLL